ncbi:DUF1642 domain-containing protein [Jeotgalibaca porci]|uniref:DUF1642 domain-containing protein n=1 Tax=Jeotgalibaca porci TaxID=1868793 RepID=UPI0035A03A56
MKKEQLKEAVGELNCVDTVFETDGVSYIDTAVSVMQVYDLIDQLDEPTKVEPLVVPKELGEWLAERHLGCQGSLFSIIGDLEDMWVGSHFEDFITDNKKSLIEVILGAREYEVEKEKLYYVLNKRDETLLVFMRGEVKLSVGYVLRDGNKEIYQLTEKQIKDYDERYWPFAVEVTE